MQLSPSISKVVKTFLEKELRLENWSDYLLDGKLYDYEKEVYAFVLRFYDKISELLIKAVSESNELKTKARALAKSKGLKKLVSRPVKLQLRTGRKIESASFYAKKAPDGYEGSRHTTVLFWSASKKSSPMYQSLTGLLSVICPSFDIGKWLLKYQGIEATFDRTRTVALSLGESAMKDRAGTQLEASESMAGKRVVISIDGGRTRTRVYETKDGEASAPSRGDKFDTPWQEPKLFVLTTIDEKGKLHKTQLPIYDTGFGAAQTFELLATYLQRLDITAAQSVQVIADGAPWIWNRAQAMLLELGVSADKIVETLDYYHAMEHAYELAVYVEKEQQTAFLKDFKQALWQGDMDEMSALVKENIPDVSLEEFKPFNYFVKNKQRIDYQRFKKEKRRLGSGIVESGIRRIIGLRFKSPSSFWYPENVEKLIFLRGVALSGRWEIMMQNLSTF